MTIEECIEFTRIESAYDPNDRTIISAGDGRFLGTIWRGNLERNTNDHTLLLFDANDPRKEPVELLTVSQNRFDETWERPLSQFIFMDGDRLALLGAIQGQTPQVYALDLATKGLTPLTSEQGGVVAFGASAKGALVYVAYSNAQVEERRADLIRDGFSLADRSVFGGDGNLSWIAQLGFIRPSLQFFLVDRLGVRPRKIHQVPYEFRPAVQMSPDGQHALVFPYARTATGEPAWGWMNMITGEIRVLDLGGRPFNRFSDRIAWSPDSSSLVVFRKSQGSSELHEVYLATGEGSVAKINLEWDWVDWVGPDEALLVRSADSRADDSGRSLAVLRRSKSGWQQPTVVSQNPSLLTLNPRYHSAASGRWVVGVSDGLSTPPELAVYDRASKVTRVLTRLNPQLQNRKRGEITSLKWGASSDQGSVGYLIKPVGYVAGRRYPLIVQINDTGSPVEDPSFILDGQGQMSAAAMQVWANAGFLVLFTPWSRAASAAMNTPEEDSRMVEHIESGLDLLEAQGLIDRRKVAITGWSRAGWQAENLVFNGRTPLAAAALIDNVEYNSGQFVLNSTWDETVHDFQRHWGGTLPWGESAARWRAQAIDEKYGTRGTPILIERHDLGWITNSAQIYAALKSAQVPIDLYTFVDAPHDLKSPRHRQISLHLNTDWFRFWLQDYEDPAPAKRAQYARWRQLRKQQAEARRSGSG